MSSLLFQCLIALTGATNPRRSGRGWYRLLPKQGQQTNKTPATLPIIDRVARRTAESRREPLVLGIVMDSHDATFAATLGGRVLGVVELERLHKTRYFDLLVAARVWGLPREEAKRQKGLGVSLYVVPALKRLCRMVPEDHERIPASDLPCNVKFDAVAIADDAPEFDEHLHRVIDSREWLLVDHHRAHAAIGWFDSPFYNRPHAGDAVSFLLSYDGIGNDGNLRTFVSRQGKANIEPVLDYRRHKISFGHTYANMAAATRDLAWGTPYGSRAPCEYWKIPACLLSLPGSFMAYAAVGTPRAEWREGARHLLTNGLWKMELWPSPHGGFCALMPHHQKNVLMWMHAGPVIGDHFMPADVKEGRVNYWMRYFHCDGTGADEEAARKVDQDFAATVELAFSTAVVAEVRTRLSLLDGPPPTSLVVCGGSALNVKTNSALARELDLPIHVPPAPGDNGLAIGAAWLVVPPPPTGDINAGVQFTGSSMTYRGSFLTVARLRNVAKTWGATKVQSVAQIASLLMEGNIIGVARSRAEFGPRALGHRSFLASAHRPEAKSRLNRLKQRRWYRPCAPIVAAEDLEKVFEPGPDLVFGTPYMSFAPPVKPWVSEWFPSMSHLDGTARPNSVRQKDDPWMHALLTSVRDAMSSSHRAPPCTAATSDCELGHQSAQTFQPVGLLINTSLNPKGMPIADDVLDVLRIFCQAEGDELNFVVLGDSGEAEEWLFERGAALSSGLCDKLSAKNATWRVGHGSQASPDGLPTI